MQKKKRKLLLNSLVSDQKFSLYAILSFYELMKRLEIQGPARFAFDYLRKWQNQYCNGRGEELTVVMVALAFPNIHLEPEPPYCYAEIAPFGRAHFYRELMDRLKALSSDLRKELGLSRKDIQLFSNSRFPEKPMAWAAGLGFLGKNTLLIHPEIGSSMVLGGMIVNFAWDDEEAPVLPLQSQCGDCRLCIQACPQGALRQENGLVLERCLQHLSSSETIWPGTVKAKWGRRFYGCELCQEVCPFYKRVSGPVSHFPGYLGPYVDLEHLLSLDPSALRAYLKPSVLGRSWIPVRALYRNAIIALQGQDFRAFEERLKSLASGADELLADAAKWLLKQPRRKQ
ncbi:MAG: hypothetical protein JXR70_01405 [Spirochaetales bacterium]|nr:hypothetical protein [Spirochaetales bacterium]